VRDGRIKSRLRKTPNTKMHTFSLHYRS